MKIKNITGKKISFDFDGTLFDEFGGEVNPQKDEIQDICKQLIHLGNDVMIITKRYSPQFSNLGLGMESNIVFYISERLGIEPNKIYFTNREMKFGKLIDLGVDIHFENADYEVQLINQACREKSVNLLVIPVEDAYWRDLIY